MKKLSFMLILTMFFVFNQSIPASALSLDDLSPGEEIPSQNITIMANYDGSFYGIAYYISSTGATSGIRYRTSAITVNINGLVATIDISSYVGHSTSGETNYSLIAVTKEDIIQSLGEQNRSLVDNISPEKIKIGANIQIYNVGTGEVLATITNKDDVAPIASSIGFGSQDISDMQSRFLGDSYAPVVFIPNGFNDGADGLNDLLLDGLNGLDDSGLRPSILVK